MTNSHKLLSVFHSPSSRIGNVKIWTNYVGIITKYRLEKQKSQADMISLKTWAQCDAAWKTNSLIFFHFLLYIESLVNFL
jgi:hypothetical protein